MIAPSPLRKSRLRAVAERYKEARKSLSTPASAQSRHGLDWMNFFIADVQSGFGAFVAFYLMELGWSQGNIGIALAVGAIVGVLSQIPGGALADEVTWKRGLVAVGILMIGAAALILALLPNFVAVLVAEFLHGATAGLITPAIGAISLGLVGRRAMSVRTGRNYRYAAGGHALTAAAMGLAGAFVSTNAIFFSAAILCIPALIALGRIRSDEIDYARSRNAATTDQKASVISVLQLAKNRRLVLFAASLVMFQLADASMLPLVGEHLATSIHAQAVIWMSVLIIIPQIVVALLAPWVGLHSEKRGRRPLLLLGFALEPIRAGLLAVTTNYPLLIAAQLLSGITGATVGVLTVLIVTDLTTGTGRFNLAAGTVGALSGIAASLSTSSTGFLFQGLGRTAGFLILSGIALAATALLWVFLSETKPEKYLD